MQHSASRDYVSASTLLPPINNNGSQAVLNNSVDNKLKDEYGYSPKQHPSGIPSSKVSNRRKKQNALAQSAGVHPTSAQLAGKNQTQRVEKNRNFESQTISPQISKSVRKKDGGPSGAAAKLVNPQAVQLTPGIVMGSQVSTR